MAIFVEHVACPKCNSRNNLAMYDDGGGWCFGCHYTISPKVSGFVTKQQAEEKTWSLPDDLTQDFPQDVLTYVRQYSITIEELIKYDYYFSKRTGRLWTVLVSGNTGQIHGYVGRGSYSAEARRCYNSKSANTPKSLFFGDKEDTFAFTGTECSSQHLVLCEDRLSSIKIGRVCQAMALFGTHISATKVMKLVRDYQYKRVTVWLDHDKFKEAWEIALKFKWLGVSTNVILTKLDPKYHSEEEIRNLLSIYIRKRKPSWLL